jgi:hypothetical protein
VAPTLDDPTAVSPVFCPWICRHRNADLRLNSGNCMLTAVRRCTKPSEAELATRQGVFWLRRPRRWGDRFGWSLTRRDLMRSLARLAWCAAHSDIAVMCRGRGMTPGFTQAGPFGRLDRRRLERQGERVPRTGRLKSCCRCVETRPAQRVDGTAGPEAKRPAALSEGTATYRPQQSAMRTAGPRGQNRSRDRLE